MTVLVVAPHPDDETLGCGGTLCRHAQAGDRLAAVFLTSGELGLKHLPARKARFIREREAKRAARILGIKRLHFLRSRDWFVGESSRRLVRPLRAILRRVRPQVLYVPHPREWHPDHRAALALVRAALKSSGLASPEVRCYEVWTPLPSHDQAEDITRFMPMKMRALRAHRSQLKEFNYERAVRALNAFRGELALRCRYAEVFQVVRPRTRP